MKKILTGLVLVCAIWGYVWWSEKYAASAPAPVAAMTATADNENASSSSAPVNPTSTQTVQNPDNGNDQSSSGSQYADGTFEGGTFSSVYGPVQVSVVITSGKISTVHVLKEPNAPGHTTDVSAMAIPQLQSEAISAQNANIDIISGATQTSQSFQQSLQSALAHAQV